MTHTLEPYSKFRPTGFDSAGLGCAEQQDWLVAPCSTTRDSESLSRANWQSMLAMLAEVDPDENDHETHHFGHWGPGWFEIVLVRPDSRAAGAMEECARKLDDYPVIDDDVLSAVEHDDENESWQNHDGREFLRAIASNLGLRAENETRVDDTDDTNERPKLGELFELACQKANAYVEHTNEGARFPIKRAAAEVDARSLAEYLRRCAAGEAIR